MTYFRVLLVMVRSSHPVVLNKKDVLRNFAKFTEKHLCESLVLNKVAGQACNFIKKQTLAQVLSCELCEISKNTFFKEHLRWLLLLWSKAEIRCSKIEAKIKTISVKTSDKDEMEPILLKSNIDGPF